jgi:acylphosphatase
MKNRPAPDQISARRWFISGRVQGVGFRWFVEAEAQSIGVTGWVRNLDDGRVEVYAAGAPEQLDRLAARLHQGPPQSIVRGLEQLEAEMQQLNSFHTK